MNQEKLEVLKNSLLAEKDDIILKSKAQNDIVDSQGDDTDAIQAKILLELNKRLAIRSKERMSQIEDALKKIEDKTYGICEDCEKEISERRLEFSPYSVTCAVCAEIREQEEATSRRL